MSSPNDLNPTEPDVLQPAFSAQMEAFTKEAGRQERWKIDHQEAMACLNLEALVAFGIMAYEAVDVADRKVRTLIATGKAKVGPEFWKMVTVAIDAWAVAVRGMIPAIDACERKGFTVDRADRLRERLAHADSVVATRRSLDFTATE